MKKKEKEGIDRKTKEILTGNNLLFNEDKTESWRNSIKLGSKLRKRKDTELTKTLSSNYTVWKRNGKLSSRQACNCMTHLSRTYYCITQEHGTCPKNDRKKLSSFHRTQRESWLVFSGHKILPTKNCMKLLR